MEGDFIKINEWLLPLSWLYGCGVKFRNFLFDAGILKSRTFNVPVISVGNITVGGTGKTPHVEYLVRLLKAGARVAVLSRGYKRKSHGFLLAAADTPMKRLGDESFQMKHKFPDVMVAVDGKRTRGISRLLSGAPSEVPDVVLLDDAFQHRYVKPGINILLVDYHRLVIYDRLLPAGRLREPLSGKNRADIVIVTKCPKDLKPMEFRVITKAMSLYPYQQLYFTTIDYEPLQPVFPDAHPKNSAAKAPTTIAQLDGEHLLLLTGIASPDQLVLDLKPHATEIVQMAHADHHNFSNKDIRQLNEAFSLLPEPRRIITTEKDATRLLTVKGLSDDVRRHLYALPIKISFMQDHGNAFNEQINNYVHNFENQIIKN